MLKYLKYKSGLAAGRLLGNMSDNREVLELFPVEEKPCLNDIPQDN
jgi:hypothetical protein